MNLELQISGHNCSFPYEAGKHGQSLTFTQGMQIVYIVHCNEAGLIHSAVVLDGSAFVFSFPRDDNPVVNLEEQILENQISLEEFSATVRGLIEKCPAVKGADAYRQYLLFTAINSKAVPYDEPFPRPILYTAVMQEWYQHKVIRRIESLKDLEPDASQQQQDAIETALIASEMGGTDKMLASLNERQLYPLFDSKRIYALKKYREFLKERLAELGHEKEEVDNSYHGAKGITAKNRRALLFLTMMESGLLPQDLMITLTKELGSNAKALQLMGLLLDIDWQNLKRYLSTSQAKFKKDKHDLRKEKHLSVLIEELEASGIASPRLNKLLEQYIVKSQQGQ